MGAGTRFTTAVGWMGGACTGCGATATGAAGGGADTGFGRRGNVTTGAPRQSFHTSVASGCTGGLPWNATSNTPRFTSLPGATRSSELRTISTCVSSSASATDSGVPGGTRKTYSRYVSGIASVASCSRLKMICDATPGPATSALAGAAGACAGTATGCLGTDAGTCAATGAAAAAWAASTPAGPAPIITVRAAAGCAFFAAGAGGLDIGRGGGAEREGASSGAFFTS
jgi:hypothetical protein